MFGTMIFGEYRTGRVWGYGGGRHLARILLESWMNTTSRSAAGLLSLGQAQLHVTAMLTRFCIVSCTAFQAVEQEAVQGLELVERRNGYDCTMDMLYPFLNS